MLKLDCLNCIHNYERSVQIDFGEYNNDKARGSGPGSNPHHLVLQALDKFYPIRYRTNITAEQLRQVQEEN